VLAVWGAAGSAAAATGGDWSQSRYSAAQNAFSPLESTISVSNVSTLHIAWQRQFPTAKFIGMPIVAGGHLFSLISGGVISMKATTGKTRWRVQLAGANNAFGIAAANGIVYVTTPDGLHALDANTGASLWTLTGSFSSPPAIADGTVFVGNASVYAVDAVTGAERWQFQTVWPYQSPIVSGGVVYALHTADLVALDADTGSALWTVRDVRPLAVYKGTLYAYNDSFDAMDASTGAIKWSYTPPGLDGCCYSWPVAANGRVYVGAGRGWVALNAGNGHVLWSRAVFLQRAEVANGVVYALEGIDGAAGTVNALDAASGTVLATLTGHSLPTIAHGVAYTVEGGSVPTLSALKP
jgi:outer membrane protein assembly factor BamB